MTNDEIIQLFTNNVCNKEKKTEKKSKTKNIFDIFNLIIKNKKLEKEDFNLITNFMLLKWLSNNKKMVKLAQELNRDNIPIENIVDIIKYELKKEKIYFIKWISSKNSYKLDKNSRELIMKEYNLNSEKLDDILDIFTREHINYIKKKYK